MNNLSSYAAMLEGAEEKGKLRRLALMALVGVLIIVICFRVHWKAGYAALIVLPPVVIVQLPKKWHRIAWTLYLVFVIALLSGTAIQSRLEAIATSGDPARRNLLIRLLLGGSPDYRITVSILLGLLSGILVVGIPLLSVMLVSSEFILALHEVFGVDRGTALRYLWSLIMGINLPWEIVEDGEVKRTKPPGVLDIIGGPGVVVIRPGNAAVFEWGGKVTKIEGPGVFKTKAFERIKKVVDLRPLWHEVKVEKVLTQDRVPLTFIVNVGYQVEPKAETEKRGGVQPSIPEAEGVIEGVHPVYKESVYRAVYRIDPASPEEAVKGILDAYLRDEVFKYNLDALYDYSVADGPRTRGNVIAAIEEAIEPRMQDTLKEWGLKLLGVDIATIEMPEDIKAKVVEWWKTAWERERMVAQAEGQRRAMIERGTGQAVALEAVEGKKDEVRERLARQLMDIVRAVAGAGVQLDSSVAVRLIGVLEAVSTRMTCDSETALRYLDALEKLVQAEGDKTLIVGESPPILIKGEGKAKG
jgi:regulator of protease activity HflC (stomatin/prohibitin superfamily)